MKPVIAEKAKENQGKRNDLTFSKNLEEVKQIYTDDKIAKTAGISTETIRKVETIEHKAPEPVVMASRKGEISVNSAPYKKAADCKSQPLFLSVSKQNSDGKSAIEEI